VNPRVSVLVPVFNSAAYLGEAIEGVLGQTRPPDEVVVVDDGSTDGSADVAKAFGPHLLVIVRPRRGVGAARNAGLEAATGNLIAMCDADDVWGPTKLERQLQLLDSDDAIGVVFTHFHEFVSPEITTPPAGARAPVDVGTAPIPSTMLARRSVLDDVGYFDESLRIGDWIEWCGRLRASGDRTEILAEPLVRRRLHGNNNSIVRAGAGEDYVRILKKHLDEARRAQ